MKIFFEKILKNRKLGYRNRSFLTSDFYFSISKCELYVRHGEANRKNLTVVQRGRHNFPHLKKGSKVSPS